MTSTIAEPDILSGEVSWVAGTYALGTRRILTSTHRVYEVVADPSTSDDPLTGIAKNPATWVDVEPTNKYKMFSDASATSSVGDNISVDITPTSLTNGIGAFNVSCESIDVTVTKGVDVVYSKSITMRNRPLVTGWYSWLFSGFSALNKFVLLDLPPVNGDKITVTFNGTGASVGNLSLGRQFSFGDAQYGTGSEVLDFSIPTQDSYGNISFSDGFKARLVTYKVKAQKANLPVAEAQITALGKTPAIWVGNPNDINDSTAVFGYNQDYNQVYSTPTLCDVNITVRGVAYAN